MIERAPASLSGSTMVSASRLDAIAVLASALADLDPRPATSRRAVTLRVQLRASAIRRPGPAVDVRISMLAKSASESRAAT